MQGWRVIEDGPKDGESNMAIDRAILASCALGKTLPTLRLYSEPTLKSIQTTTQRTDFCFDSLLCTLIIFSQLILTSHPNY